jgi:multiple antibiotic resistance protein
MPLTKVALLSFIALITMVNPLAVIPSFVALTEGASRRTRASVAFMAGHDLECRHGDAVAAPTTPAARKRMEDADVVKAEIDPTSIAVVPLAIPMLSGPGAITTVMVLVNLYPGMEQKMAVIVAIAAVGAVSYLVLLAAVPLSRMVGNRGRTVFSKIMALLLGAIGIQFIINGIKPVALELLRTA